MFSKEYFNYLVKSKRYLLLIILLITLLNVFGTTDAQVSFGIEGVIALLLCFFLPVYVFHYVHDKKAVDTFFSIPVSRTATLFSGLLFCILTAYIPLALVSLFFGVVNHLGIIILINLLELLVMVSALIVFNTAIYLIANNVFDGIVMIGAYSFLPIMLLIIINCFVENYVAGMYAMDTPYLAYLSPTWMSISTFIEMIRKSYGTWHIVGLLVILVVFTFILYKEYTNRDVERAATPSTKVYAYPVIIYTYVALSLFIIASMNNYTYGNIFDFMKEVFIVYVLLFAVFVAAHFVYKRKLYFNYKLPLFYVLALILSLTATTVFKANEAFGLSQHYNHNDPYAYYDLYTYNGVKDKKLLSFIEDSIGEEVYDISISVYGPGSYDYINMGKLRISDESVQIFENIRQEAIKQYYEYHETKDDEEINYAHLGVNTRDKSYNYSFIGGIDYDSLLKLAKDKNITVSIYANFNTYTLLPDGTLSLNEIIDY